MTTIVKSTPNKLHLQAGDLQFTFWESGDLYQATCGRTMINQMLTSPIDGSLNNLYLRIIEPCGIRFYPLLGIHSTSKLYNSSEQLVWRGQADQIEYEVRFSLTEQGIWFWDVVTHGNGVTIDVVYGQDIGNADIGAVRSNEAYLSQYIDHAVFEDEDDGYVICSRQNQPQGGAFPYVQQGSLTRAVGYSTDGFQFYGLSYKETNVPEALLQPTLANAIYQYEFAYTALQSKQVELAGEARFVFYGIARANHPEAVTALEYKDEVKEAWTAIQSNTHTEALIEQPAAEIREAIGEPLLALSMTDEELNVRFPKRYQEERQEDQLLAFFTDTFEHIVLKEKELLVERPHGHILMSGNNVKLGAEVITTTSYMYGIFNSHVVIGNTNFNKMMSNARSHLNVPKTAGQRIYVEMDQQYHLLTMPSMFEIGFNYVRWYYKTADDMLIITNYAAVDSPELRLHFTSEQGISYRFLVTTQVTMNVNEYETPFVLEKGADYVLCRPDSRALSSSIVPELQYRMSVAGSSITTGDERLLAKGVHQGDASLVTLHLDSSHDWTLTIQAQLEGEITAPAARSAHDEIAAYRAFFKEIMNGFHLSPPEGEHPDSLFKLNALAWWYTHNMLVHYSVPHGLEQYGGAAWGTRDVCQGPVEYFMATQKYEQVRGILRMVYAHQYEDDGNWPQWFMFDSYFSVQQEESHGDIIVWPLKVLSDYLNATQDYSILEEQIPYTLKDGFCFSEHKESVLAHVKKELAYICTHFLHDTHLSSYGDGDWDDTLQPANAQLKTYMVSSWTVALTYQTLTQLSKALAQIDAELSAYLHSLSSNIAQDFNAYMLQADVIPGFLYLEDPDNPKLMLHPSDSETGIQYRLLPMTRSIIAELLDQEQAKFHSDLIQKELLFPDGVRLMNRPAQYAGGVSTYFKRAEQAANFGREVGLQYVHAHIRYVEAMAKLGHAEEAWNGLEVINPVGIKEVVPHAAYRQSNAYFSSSDGKFDTRYEAQEHMDALRQGEVQVKGGWRIYSSGPGIYMNQLISNVLGIRFSRGDLILDPVLPARLSGMRFDYRVADKQAALVYHIAEGSIQRVLVNGIEVELSFITNPYRNGGVRISKAILERELSSAQNTIDIFM